MSINGTDDLTQDFSGWKRAIFRQSDENIIEFDWNFDDAKILDLSQISIQNENVELQSGISNENFNSNELLAKESNAPNLLSNKPDNKITCLAASSPIGVVDIFVTLLVALMTISGLYTAYYHLNKEKS